MFAILFEVLLIQVQEEIYHFAGWEEGGVKGHNNCEQTFCEQTGVSYWNSGQTQAPIGHEQSRGHNPWTADQN